MDGQLERTDKGLKIEIEADEPTYKDVFEYLADDMLFWNDMYFQTYGSEWLYIEDANHNKVYMVNGYGYDCIDELVKKGETTIQESPISYEEYQKDKGASLKQQAKYTNWEQE